MMIKPTVVSLILPADNCEETILSFVWLSHEGMMKLRVVEATSSQ